MKINLLSDDLIKEIIPNVMLEVEGEIPFIDKLAPWILSAKNWLESEYIGPDNFLSEADNCRALHIVVLKAFADAVPSLDLVVTPTGFGVVSTDSVAPASKERIERLLESLRSEVDVELRILLEVCHQYEEWRSSERGKYFCATFLSSLRDYGGTTFDSYDDMRSKAMHVESIMAEEYLGKSMMDRLRDKYNSRKPSEAQYLADFVHSAIKEIIYRPQPQHPIKAVVWFYCRQIFERLPNFPEYFEIWKAEMGESFNQQPFKNNIKGSYYF
ncbi:MAG: hypothetical protein K2M56_00985 [Muribaculaceae bacterium]|nr:hypothetical protein [Muribaculaceae bacterium]